MPFKTKETMPIPSFEPGSKLMKTIYFVENTLIALVTFISWI